MSLLSSNRMLRGKSWIRCAAVVVLLTSLCAGTMSRPHAASSDDLACNPVGLAHDESAHYIGAAARTLDPHADHCFICHSLRGLSAGFEKYVLRDNALSAEGLHTGTLVIVDRFDWSLTPGRAPPA